MIPYKLDYTIEKILENRAVPEQKLLKQFTGKSFAKAEAKIILKKVEDHKWYLSERFGRDVRMRVAAIDYLENIDQLPSRRPPRQLMTYSSLKPISLA